MRKIIFFSQISPVLYDFNIIVIQNLDRSSFSIIKYEQQQLNFHDFTKDDCYICICFFLIWIWILNSSENDSTTTKKNIFFWMFKLISINMKFHRSVLVDQIFSILQATTPQLYIQIHTHNWTNSLYFYYMITNVFHTHTRRSSSSYHIIPYCFWNTQQACLSILSCKRNVKFQLFKFNVFVNI